MVETTIVSQTIFYPVLLYMTKIDFPLWPSDNRGLFYYFFYCNYMIVFQGYLILKLLKISRRKGRLKL